MNTRTQILGLVFFLVLCLIAGWLGSIATTPEIGGWCKSLNKPTWNPPAYVFGPVWTTLYILMALAAWLVWKKKGFGGAKLELGLFGIQLLLNVAWSWIFFHFHQPGWAFVELVVLWVTIVTTTLMFFRVSKVAGGLMLPYLGWVTFASVLNFTIWQLNLVA